MENYLYISSAISLVVLIFIKYGKATSNANYYLSSLAIISWFIPYPHIADLIPKEVLVEPVIIAMSQVSYANIVSHESSIYFDIELWLKWGLWAFMSIGIILMLNRVISFTKWKGLIKNDSSLTQRTELTSKHQVPIYSANKISSGLLLGIFNPIIIISKSITDPKHIELIIAHEKQHLESKDNLRLMLLEVVECLFWWNPLIRRLINANRFFIEAKCDERTSKKYGHYEYIEDLASLILFKQNETPSNLVCTATSNSKNNIARIKLLKEKREMSLRKKLTYLLIAFSTLTTISWNTLATATSNDKAQQAIADQKQLGVLVSFDAIITNKLIENEEDTYRYQVTYWAEFNEKFTFNLGEFGLDMGEPNKKSTFKMRGETTPKGFIINITAKDLGDSAELEYELIESTQSTEKIVSRPRLKVNFGKEATINIDNPRVSKYEYLIKATPLKAQNPTLSNEI